WPPPLLYLSLKLKTFRDSKDTWTIGGYLVSSSETRGRSGYTTKSSTGGSGLVLGTTAVRGTTEVEVGSVLGQRRCVVQRRSTEVKLVLRGDLGAATAGAWCSGGGWCVRLSEQGPLGDGALFRGGIYEASFGAASVEGGFKFWRWSRVLEVLEFELEVLSVTDESWR
ncbi:hypothetical protein PanWU01x14_363150, partial [Parasponia andersonii]